jgi:hypothetical protein
MDHEGICKMRMQSLFNRQMCPICLSQISCAEIWSGRRDSNPQLPAWESNPVVLVYQHFSIFPKVFAIAYLALFAFPCPICTLFWDIFGTSTIVTHSPRQYFEECVTCLGP